MNTDKKKSHINFDFFEDLTGDIQKPTHKAIDSVGVRIKKLREEKGVTLANLSNLTGFDVELLSDIENNNVQPQLGTVIKLSKALDSAFGRLISGVGDKLYSITRKNDRKIISRSTSREDKKQIYTYMGLAPEVKGRHIEAFIVQLEKDPREEISVHEGEEFIFVIDGTVKLKIGEDRFNLEQYDSAYYLSTTPHHISSISDKATILAVLYEGL